MTTTFILPTTSSVTPPTPGLYQLSPGELDGVPAAGPVVAAVADDDDGEDWGSLDGSLDADPLGFPGRVCKAAGADVKKFRHEASDLIRLAGGVDAACELVRGRGGQFMREFLREYQRTEAREAVRALRAAGAGTVDLDTVGAVDLDDDDEFFASLAAAAPVPAVHGVFYRTGLHLVAGAPGCGKTWASLAVLAAMASPTLYPSLRISDTARRPVIYIDADGNGRSSLWRRLLQLGVDVGDLRAGGDVRVVSLPDLAAERGCSLEAALQATITAAVEANAASLVLDTITRAIVAAGGDSNSADSVTAVLNLLAPLAETACVIALDHTGHEHKERPAGSIAKIGAPNVVLVMEKMRGGSDDYPDTVLSAVISVVKDREGGILSHTCAPDDDRRAGVWVLRDTDMTVEGVSAPRLAVEMVPARASAEKKAREAAEAAEAATPVAEIIAAAVREEEGALSRSAAVKAIRAGREGETVRGAEAALDAAVAAGTVVETPDARRSDWRRYGPTQPAGG